MISTTFHSIGLQLPPPEEKKPEDPSSPPQGLLRSLSTTQRVAIGQIIGHHPEHPLTTEIFRVTLESLLRIRKEEASNGLKFPVLSFPNPINPATVVKVKLIVSPFESETKPGCPYLLVSTTNKGTFKKHFESLDLERIVRCAFLVMKEGTADEPTKHHLNCDLAIRNLKTFSSPGVAALLDDFVYPSIKPQVKKFALILERCDGDLSSEPRPVPKERFLQIFTRSAEALLAFHSNGTVHRDIKPHNLGVQENPTNPLDIKLLDLDFACPIGSPFHACGTPLYVAPEIIRTMNQLRVNPLAPPPPASPAQDVWSLGCSMAILATNAPQLLFQEKIVEFFIGGDRLSRVPLNHLVRESIDRQMPTLSPAIKQILLRMLQENPQKRPSMHAVVERLKLLQLPHPHPLSARIPPPLSKSADLANT